MSRNLWKNVKELAKNRRYFLAILVAIVIPSLAAALFSLRLVFGIAAQTIQTTGGTIPDSFYGQYGMGLLAAGVAVAGSCVGAGIAISGAASAGAAAIAERPETSIWVLILAGLGEGVAIYGLLIAILILGKLPAVG
jgi:V/A-type H+-transporting ATPase subunit K